MLTTATLLASRMLIVAAIVVSVSVVVARSGPMLGAMLAALPISAGPAYVFLALDHGPDFIVRSTITSILAVCATSPFVVAHGLVSRVAGTTPSFCAAVGTFAATVWITTWFDWTLGGALVAGTSMVVGGIIATRRARREATAFVLPNRRIDLVIRAAAVMSVVATVTVLGDIAGPRAAGYGALMPVVFMSFIIVMQPRVGGPALSGLFAHALFGIMGFVPAFAVVNLATGSLGMWWALGLGLATSLGWNAAIVLLRRQGWLRL